MPNKLACGQIKQRIKKWVGQLAGKHQAAKSERSMEQEIENLLARDTATRADLVVALRKMQKEMAKRTQAQEALLENEKCPERPRELPGHDAHGPS
jgi:hypothetical protein